VVFGIRSSGGFIVGLRPRVLIELIAHGVRHGVTYRIHGNLCLPWASLDIAPPHTLLGAFRGVKLCNDLDFPPVEPLLNGLSYELVKRETVGIVCIGAKDDLDDTSSVPFHKCLNFVSTSVLRIGPLDSCLQVGDSFGPALPLPQRLPSDEILDTPSVLRSRFVEQPPEGTDEGLGLDVTCTDLEDNEAAGWINNKRRRHTLGETSLYKVFPFCVPQFGDFSRTLVPDPPEEAPILA
jgi:hypothetical protein